MPSNKFDIRHDVFHIPSRLRVCLKLYWEFIGAKPVDLDASAVAFGADGKCLDVVYFNHTSSKGDYMRHSGDATTGEDDESITFNLGEIPSKVQFIMVCVTSYSGIPFTVVESASCRLINLATDEIVHEFALGNVGNRTGTVLCALSRDVVRNGDDVDPIWALWEINSPYSGFTFFDMIPRMLELLPDVTMPLEEALQDFPKYSLEKDTDDTKGITPSQLTMGLGWDGDNDLDANLVMLTEDGEYVDHVFAKHGKLRSAPVEVIPVEGADPILTFAVRHSGDKLNGYDVDGDDEFIEVDLNALDSRICKVFFIVQLASGTAKTLSSVENGYVRMRNKAPKEEKPKEFDRLALKVCGNATSLVFSMAHRQPGAVWEYLRLNEMIAEGRDWIDIFPYLRSFSKCFKESPEKWNSWKTQAVQPFYVLIEFVEARNLGPLEPHQFSCHCEAWVCDKKGKGRFTTAICEDRDNVRWDVGAERNSHPFKVRLIDRLRIMLYEHAMIGHVDIDMGNGLGDLHVNPLEKWFPLQGVEISGEIFLKVKRISDEEANKLLAPPGGSGKWCVIA